MTDDALSRLAARTGILSVYHDLGGTEHVTGPESQAALLSAMGLPTEEAAAAEALQTMEAADGARTLPRDLVIEAEKAVRLRPSGGLDAWDLEFENGEVISGRDDDGIHLPPLPAGYHRLWRGDEATLLIVAPCRASNVADRCGNSGIWGMTAALYGLRSERNHGIGDYEDLARTAESLAGLGADFLGINPVHALGTHAPVISPYSPSHRGALNTRHIALDRVFEMKRSEPARRLMAGSKPAIAELRDDAHLDYAAAHRISLRILRALFDAFEETGEETGRRQAFEDFRRSRGSALEAFALFEALSDVYGPKPAEWPTALQSPDSREVREFAEAYAREIRFHIYLQWLADEQLTTAGARSQAAGMRLGLYTDLAVGVRPSGAEPWSRPDVFASGVSLGAPPDGFNPHGQEWGLAPFNPMAVQHNAYQPVIETLRAAMRHAGLIRIDHAIGLVRCFWVPESGAPGAFVRSPLQETLAVVRIEAARAGCIVVGEDLGVVPAGLRDAMSESGLYGVSVMQFEREDDGAFRHPHHHRSNTLASFGTHDTPTMAGFWQGCDIDQRVTLGQFTEVEAHDAHDERARTRSDIIRLLADIGAWAASPDGETLPANAGTPLIAAMHAALAETRAEMVAVQLDDALGSLAQPNFPGTVDAYPNWRIKAAMPVEAMHEAPGLSAVADIMRVRRRGCGGQAAAESA